MHYKKIDRESNKSNTDLLKSINIPVGMTVRVTLISTGDGVTRGVIKQKIDRFEGFVVGCYDYHISVRVVGSNGSFIRAINKVDIFTGTADVRDVKFNQPLFDTSKWYYNAN